MTIRSAYGRTGRQFLVSVALCGALLPGAARAASVSGTITDSNAVGLGGIEVEARAQSLKGSWELVASDLTLPDGSYALVGLASGSYRLRAVVPAGVAAADPRFNQSALYYDQVAPLDGGWTVEGADDLLLPTGSSTLTGIDLSLPTGFALEGEIAVGGVTLAGQILRAELRVDERQFFEVASSSMVGGDPTTRGQFLLPGLEPSTPGTPPGHRLLSYDPQGLHESVLLTSPPMNGAAGTILPVGTITTTPFSDLPDPYEPNGSALPGQVTPVPVATLRAGGTWTTTGAILEPGDTDWYCWDALPNESYGITSTTAQWLDASGSCCTDQLDGQRRYNPWLDPVLRLFRNGTTIEVEDDDSAPLGIFDAQIFTGEVVGSPSYCVIVSTYGDTGFSGVGQQSFGRYALEFRMMPLRPLMVVTDSTGNTVNDGDGRVIDEGDTFTLDIAHSGGPGSTVTVEMKDSSGQNTGQGFYDPATGQWSWTAGQGDAGTYTVTITVCDGGLCQILTMNLTVNPVNLGLGVPVQLSPADGAQVATPTADLIVENAQSSGTGPITYGFELYYYTNPGPIPLGVPDQAVTGHPEGAGGQTRWTTSGIPENTPVFWRVRALQGAPPGGYSPWSGYFIFLANLRNSEPLAPLLVRPMEGETLSTRAPVLEVTNATDPEGDPIELGFEIATDDTFSTIVLASPLVPQDESESFTRWSDPASPLDWSTPYAARAWAQDSWGARSPFSNIVHFVVRTAPPLPEVTLGAPFSPATCQEQVLTSRPMAISVSRSTDPEGERVVLDLEIHDFDAVPGADPPVIRVIGADQDPAGGETAVPIDGALLAEDGHYRVRARARSPSDLTQWAECDFWLDEANSPPGAVSILQPVRGASFPADTLAVAVVVRNADDAESGMPGSTLAIALCASADPAFADCDPDPASWQLASATPDPVQTTELLVVGLFDGTPLAPELTVHLRACALDEDGACGAADTSDFSLAALPTTCAELPCPAGEVCDPATVTCLSDPGPDGGPGDGGPDGGVDGGSAEPTGGCCRSDSAAGSPRLALAVLFVLAIVATSRRRFS